MPEIKEATPGEVRAWAHGKNMRVPERGPIPKPVVDAFNKAHRTKKHTPRYRPTRAEQGAREPF